MPIPEINKIYNCDCLEGLKTLPDESVNCCVTSPPYFGLRDYGTAKWEGGDSSCTHEQAKARTRFDYPLSEKQSSSKGTDVPQYKAKCDCGAVRVDGQIGLEETPELFVQKMVEVFTEVRRVLKKDGTLWLNLGDSYSTNGVKNTGRNDEGTTSGQGGAFNGGNKKQIRVHTECKPKDLIGIPWMVAFALRSSGWYLRQDIIWHKPNPMPESVTDRCTKAHEYIFLLSKSAKYYYDHEAIKVDGLNPADDIRRKNQQRESNKSNPTELKNGIRPVKRNLDAAFMGNAPTNYYRCGEGEDGKANKRSVWTVTTKPFSEAHFATFPEDLIVDCIKAGCPENGLVLDPFSGAGTTALVASKLNRNFVGFELNPEYIEITKKRLQNELGMFNKLTA